MFCSQCGAALEGDSKFCGKCGHLKEDMAIPVQIPPRKKSLTRIIAPIAVVAIFAVVAFVAFLRVSPLIAVQRSIVNLSGELATRIETTPFHAIPLATSALGDGTVEVDFFLRDGWVNMGLNATIQTDSRRQQQSVEFALNSMGFRVDAELYVDSNTAAFRSGLLGRDFYGINFATFRDDIRPLGRRIGLSPQEMNALADFVEAIETNMNRDVSDILEDYISALTSFLRGSDFSSSRSGGVTRVEFNFTQGDLSALLRDLVAVFENDDTMRSIFDAFDALDGGHGSAFADISWMMRDAIRELERDFDIDAALIFYIGRRNRLNQILLVLDYEELRWGDRHSGVITADFGSSATDSWRFSAYTGRDSFYDYITWEYETIRNQNLHTLTINEHFSEHPYIVTSEWNPQTGDFTIAYTYRDRWSGRRETTAIDGNFTTGRNGAFELNLNPRSLRELTGADISLEIGASPATNINRPDNFINIDQWDETLAERLEDLFWDILINIF
ncbi:MAG: zinc ribbon domain-containing protein [Defluviitaleaceae bacterium]|nr:zinc ribbon domain-containing protein [Defluviitaleaceae bacterium]